MKPIPTYQKLRGGYYTPKPIADFLARWAINDPTTEVLDPSCGDGNLLESAVRALRVRGAEKKAINDLIHGVELDPDEAFKASERVSTLTGSSPVTGIQVGDFFSSCKKMHESGCRYDAIIGNPPFIRYQNFPEEYRRIAFYLMQYAGLHPNRLTNAWVPFLVASSLLLNERGRLAMVIPAELLQVNYAAELRYFLSHYYGRITLITFKRLVFDGIQQEVVLLLGERSCEENQGIATIELEGIDDLQRLRLQARRISKLKEVDHSTDKWTKYFLDNREIHLLRELRSDLRLAIARDVIDVDVGIVTGMNDFFVLSEEQIKQYSLEAFVRGLVGRSAHLQGIIFSQADWKANMERQSPAYLLDLPDVAFESLPGSAQSYILGGEQIGLHTGYKCRIRKRWYVVPSVWEPQAFMLRQIHHYPKIILNEAAVTCTDTIHRVKIRNGMPAKTVAAAFLNSLTFAFSEVIGRSYGGGVLELEPNEAEMLPLPLAKADLLDAGLLDSLLRQTDISTILNITDDVLLRNGLGLSKSDILLLRNIWQKLRDRRINRKPESSIRRARYAIA